MRGQLVKSQEERKHTAKEKAWPAVLGMLPPPFESRRWSGAPGFITRKRRPQVLVLENRTYTSAGPRSSAVQEPLFHQPPQSTEWIDNLDPIALFSFEFLLQWC